MRRRFGVIGCGLVGRKRAVAATASLEIVAFHDLDRQRAEDLRDLVSPSAAVATDVAELCREVGPSGIVAVATTHDALAELGEAAAHHGCHVLVEKPGGRRPDELRRLAAVAQQRGVVAHVGFNHRFHPAVVTLLQKAGSGEFGELLLIRGRYGHGGRLGYEHEWRADAARSGGGELMDQGVHLLDLVLAVGGCAELRYAAIDTLFWPMAVEDNAFLHLSVGDRAHAWLHATWTEWKNLFSLEVTYRTAKFELTGLGGSYGPERLTQHVMSGDMGPPMSTTWEWPVGDGSWGAELDDLVASIEGEPARGTTMAQGIRVLELVEQAYAR